MEIEPDQDYRIIVTVANDECDIGISGWTVEALMEQIASPERTFLWFETEKGKFGLDSSQISRITIERI